jgi:hypothetical protein
MSTWDDRYTRSACLSEIEPTIALQSYAHSFPANAWILCLDVAKARKLAAKQGVDASFRVAIPEDHYRSARQCDGVVGTFIQFAALGVREPMFERIKVATRSRDLIFRHAYTQKQLEYGAGGPPLADFLHRERLLRERFNRQAGSHAEGLRDFSLGGVWSSRSLGGRGLHH